MQGDECLEVNRGWWSHESFVVSVIVLYSGPLGETMWWSVPQLASNQQTVTFICGFSSLHWVALRLRYKLKHCIKKWLLHKGPTTLEYIRAWGLVLVPLWANASCTQSWHRTVLPRMERMEILWKRIEVVHNIKALCLTPSRAVWTLHVHLVSVWVLSRYFGFPLHPTVQIHTSWANWLFTVACRSDCRSMCLFCFLVFILTHLPSTLMQCFSTGKLKIYGNARKVLVLKCHSCSINAEDPAVKVEDFCIDLNTRVTFLTGSYHWLRHSLIPQVLLTWQTWR